ncbi:MULTISPECIES: hypothetical protein [Rhizobium]|uniref:hypothetical protein n=1 Tax=Rhizobium TaxID=379 RepID=UPI00104029CA|nr:MULTISPECIES: hypothetical protein [Rhizobium]MBY4592274.1 hypothetical protein [Rhizobium redzepovicii]MBY4617205.1 hypothetical protein [Rhizobium redzepovicii]TBY44497.1 hypothetical protein E0H54_25235 [Rhizobium leguminosarum bv. viciae]ULJ81539.1 hypothetical protein MF410_27935 [Rhizobium sp. C104]
MAPQAEPGRAQPTTLIRRGQTRTADRDVAWQAAGKNGFNHRFGAAQVPDFLLEGLVNVASPNK